MAPLAGIPSRRIQPALRGRRGLAAGAGLALGARIREGEEERRHQAPGQAPPPVGSTRSGCAAARTDDSLCFVYCRACFQ